MLIERRTNNDKPGTPVDRGSMFVGNQVDVLHHYKHLDAVWFNRRRVGYVRKDHPENVSFLPYRTCRVALTDADRDECRRAAANQEQETDANAHS